MTVICTHQGYYASTESCDHFITCTAGLSIQYTPCPIGNDGRRLYFDPTSDPQNNGAAACDYPEAVICDLNYNVELARSRGMVK
ncbi:hypothetical protein [Kitasatospora sp. NPDC005751]|uniref:hypothetical protein n=1 Tax=Kitasatospora sp. NPDC005751 TaxID=3157064 RepID=UPI0033F87C09